MTSDREIIASKLVKSLRAGQTLKGLGDRLLALAEHNYTLRRLDDVERICLYMLSLPLDAHHHSGAIYYYGLCGKRRGKTAFAKALFERLTEDATPRFRAKAFSSLAAIAMDGGDYRTSSELYCECARMTIRDSTSTLADVAQAHRALAVMKSIDGDHRGSLVYLEKILPLARMVKRSHPHTYYDILNSLAVELSEAGRTEEARDASEIALSSVFAPAYPEWQETREEIAAKASRKSRSHSAAASVKSNPINIVRFPVAGQSPVFDGAERLEEKRGRILSFQHWKKSMQKKAVAGAGDRPARLLIKKMSLSEKQIALMRLIFQEGVTEETLDRLLTAIEELDAGN